MVVRYIVLRSAPCGGRQCLMEYIHRRLDTGSIALHVVEQQVSNHDLSGTVGKVARKKHIAFAVLSPGFTAFTADSAGNVQSATHIMTQTNIHVCPLSCR